MEHDNIAPLDLNKLKKLVNSPEDNPDDVITFSLDQEGFVLDDIDADTFSAIVTDGYKKKVKISQLIFVGFSLKHENSSEKVHVVAPCWDNNYIWSIDGRTSPKMVEYLRAST